MGFFALWRHLISCSLPSFKCSSKWHSCFASFMRTFVPSYFDQIPKFHVDRLLKLDFKKVLLWNLRPLLLGVRNVNLFYTFLSKITSLLMSPNRRNATLSRLPLILLSFKSLFCQLFQAPHTCYFPFISLISSHIHAIHLCQEATSWTIFFCSPCNWCLFYFLILLILIIFSLLFGHDGWQWFSTPKKSDRRSHGSSELMRVHTIPDVTNRLFVSFHCYQLSLEKQHHLKMKESKQL